MLVCRRELNSMVYLYVFIFLLKVVIACRLLVRMGKVDKKCSFI